jgi:hypothetical protein
VAGRLRLVPTAEESGGRRRHVRSWGEADVNHDGQQVSF